MKSNKNENSTSKNNLTQSSLHAAATFLPGDLTATVWSGGGYITNSQCAMLAMEVSIDGERTHCHFFKIRI